MSAPTVEHADAIVTQLSRRVAASRVRNLGWIVLVGMAGTFATSSSAGIPIGTLTIGYNIAALATLGVLVALAWTRRLPLRFAPWAGAIVWCAPVGGTLMSQLDNGNPQLAILVLMELAGLAMIVSTPMTIAVAVATLAAYLPLVVRDAHPIAMYSSVVCTAAVFGVVLQILARQSLVHSELSRTAEQAAAAELERKLAELRKSEAERAQLEDRLLHAQRLEAVGTLAAGIAHDMNNVLAGIANYANAILVDAPEDAEHVQKLLDQVTRGGELTRGLLAFSRRGKYRKQRVRLADVIADVAPTVQPTLPANVSLVVASGTANAMLDGDRVQLRQVIVNLCLNAADAMPDGGTVVLASDRAVLDDTEALELGVAPGPYLRFHVADTGTGMDEVTRRRLFEPFFTTKPVGKGTGLGLALVWGVVQAHGGTIHVASEPGRGSRFTVLLPEATAIEADASTAPVVVTGADTVLVIDDEATVRNGTRRMLERKGYRVLVAADGAEGLALFAQHASAIGLVILDMGMPVMGGAECFAKLRERSEVPVLIATGYAVDAELQDILARGAALIEKPYTARELLATVARMFASNSPPSSTSWDSPSQITPV
ncbi:MAG TPA: ATP-binding protein [Kofleriaceae bacterium]|nr:ATP-binding protein [Kofleriaceae bacterium]